MTIKFYVALRKISCALACFAPLMLTGCTHVQYAEYAPAPVIPEDAHPAPIRFSGARMKLPTGSDIGLIRNEWLFLCIWGYAPVGRADIRKEVIGEDLRQSFYEALSGEGYDITGGDRTVFEPEEEENEALRSEYRVGASILDVKVDACQRQWGVFPSVLTTASGVKGELSLEVEWNVYDALRRQSVYKVRTKGYTAHAWPNEEGFSLMLGDAFEMAAHNLGADPGFRDLIVSGIRPPKESEHKSFDGRSRKFDPLEALTIPAMPLSSRPFESHVDSDRNAVVLVQGGIASHGSGYFISEQGHILTNQHVVGDARRVRIVTSDRKEGLVAEVLRVDKMRDVALLKLEKIPAEMKIVTLPIRTEWPKLSEPVFLIGAPLLTRLQGTVTRGIVSSLRKEFAYGERQDYIQSDVGVQGGNSGGPLLDGQGNIIGMCVSGIGPGVEGVDSGLNLFIPIAGALKVLKIDIVGGEAFGPARL